MTHKGRPTGRERTSDDRLLVKLPAAARLLDISRSQAYAMVRKGQLPGVVRLGRSIRVSVRELEQWIEEASGMTRPDPGQERSG